MMNQFKEYAQYYNLFYGDKDYHREAETVNEIIAKYSKLIDGRSLLNLGCGTGRHDYELTQLGWNTKGVDLSDNMIDVANKSYSSLGMRFEVGDIRSYHDGDKYDVCTALFHVMSYQTSNEDIIAAFSTANHELKAGGLFVFDCWYGPGVLTDRPSIRIKQVEDENNVFIRHALPDMYADRNVVDVKYDVLVINKQTGIAERLNETHSMRYMFTPEIKLLLENAGFSMETCIDCATLAPVTYESWTAYFVARKVREI